MEYSASLKKIPLSKISKDITVVGKDFGNNHQIKDCKM